MTALLPFGIVGAAAFLLPKKELEILCVETLEGGSPGNLDRQE